MPSITSANAVFTLAIAQLFPAPVRLQGFSADDIFAVDPLASSQTIMGVDGRLSAGFVYNPVVQAVVLQADSDSNQVFETWHEQSVLARDVFAAEGIVLLRSVGKKWTMQRGFLTAYPPMPNAGKVLAPRRYAITWQKVVPAPVTI